MKHPQLNEGLSVLGYSIINVYRADSVSPPLRGGVLESVKFDKIAEESI